jgi:hypothetical protein
MFQRFGDRSHCDTRCEGGKITQHPSPITIVADALVVTELREAVNCGSRCATAPVEGAEKMAVVRAVPVVQVESSADAATADEGTDTTVSVADAVGAIASTTNTA